MLLFDSQSGKKRLFKPLHNKVTVYVCGITPYDTTHLGHASTYVFFDALRRYLHFKGFQIVYTQNVTDIDDDILKRAKQTGTDWRKLGELWTKRFLNDMKGLNVIAPTYYVKATDSIPTIIRIVKHLLDKDHAYEVEGNVFFNTRTFKHYGQLSHYNVSKMVKLLKERGGDPYDIRKKNPLDFILWQKSRSDEPYWESPWGRGRPGWHIECSAMIYRFLGDRIDIHGGGHDLIYPHHESEIAQSESFTGKSPFVRFWLHTAMVRYKGEKMSKSLGNLIMVSDLLKKYSANVIRYVLLSHHYRESWEFAYRELNIAKEKLKRITKLTTGEDRDLKQFQSYMDDDMQTPKALTLLHNQTVYQTLGFK